MGSVSKARAAISKKIAHLRSEGVPEKQAVAEAMDMAARGRLTPQGQYIRKKKRKKRP